MSSLIRKCKELSAWAELSRELEETQLRWEKKYVGTKRALMDEDYDVVLFTKNRVPSVPLLMLTLKSTLNKNKLLSCTPAI